MFSCKNCLDGNVSVQKKFVRKEFNFGLQERLTGTVMPVEESDFKVESTNSNNSIIRCVSEMNSTRKSFSYLLSNKRFQRVIFKDLYLLKNIPLLTKTHLLNLHHRND